jgi:hypothetical protein
MVLYITSALPICLPGVDTDEFYHEHADVSNSLFQIKNTFFEEVHYLLNFSLRDTLSPILPLPCYIIPQRNYFLGAFA